MSSVLAAIVLGLTMTGPGHAAQATVVNMIPNAQSGEINQDSEPNLAVNPASPTQIAGSAFTPSQGFCGPNLAPIFVSTNGGDTWAFNCIVPSNAAGGGTGDITVRFAGTTNNLYAGILRRPGSLRLNILRTNNFVGPAAMTVLVDRNSVDQPYVQATTVGGNDRVYVGDNDFAVPGPGRRTATIDQSLNAAIIAPAFASIRIETRSTGAANQDGPPIRPAIHSDGTIYGIFYHWTNKVGNFSPNATLTSDVVVVRDDTGGTGAVPFTALVDAGDGLPGMRVVQNRTVPWANTSQANFGQERFVGSNASIAVDPRKSSTVYIAWADRVGNNDYTLHVRRSLDRGVTWSTDLRTITNATNPALAINSEGTVGFLYQQITSAAATIAQRWVTHFERTDDGFTTVQDLVLANVPANAPVFTFLPYIGDYDHVMAAGSDFYGIFSANNTPDLANFPNGVQYQRNANFVTKTLLDTDHVTLVPISIDPFFFKVEAEKRRALQYAVKFVCGKSDGKIVAPGIYFTAINVHNPSDKPVAFRKKFAIALPREKAGPVTRFFGAKLGPDEAFEIDCPDIVKHAESRGGFLKGFAVIESDVELDVVAVYTAAGASGQVETLHLERVAAGRMKKGGLPDLLPVPDPRPGVGFCRISPQGKLTVTVKNQGSADAAASTTTVSFSSGATVSQNTPAIAAGASVDLLFDIPPDCFRPDCRFRITADSAGDVGESDEGNNTADGGCIG